LSGHLHIYKKAADSIVQSIYTVCVQGDVLLVHRGILSLSDNHVRRQNQKVEEVKVEWVEDRKR